MSMWNKFIIFAHNKEAWGINLGGLVFDGSQIINIKICFFFDGGGNDL